MAVVPPTKTLKTSSLSIGWIRVDKILSFQIFEDMIQRRQNEQKLKEGCGALMISMFCPGGGGGRFLQIRNILNDLFALASVWNSN